ncbi:MAG: 16S rRNA (adenine(1518)-N(6)/adenine(1519)-N(6))-dimethyltransferase RsmA [Oscillospiraceae bacterium]
MSAPAPKKHLGQNFLINTGVCEKIALACGGGVNTGVIEIGPGRGALTCELAKCAARVVAIELDEDVIPVLADKLSSFDNVDILSGDALEVDFRELAAQHLAGMDVVIAGNLPYYITSPLVMKVLESRTGAKHAVFMVQKEAAARLCAAERSRECGASTLAVRWYSEPEILFDVSPGSFFPAPSVMSTVVRFTLREGEPEQVRDATFMFSLIKAAFSQRRKTAANAISSGARLEKAAVISAMRSLGIDESIRPERLGMSEYAALSDALGQA